MLSFPFVGHRLGVDIGGTFTDFVLLDEASGQIWHGKVPSTPADPSRGATPDRRTFLNTETHWWDASQVYGSTPEFQAMRGWYEFSPHVRSRTQTIVPAGLRPASDS